MIIEKNTFYRRTEELLKEYRAMKARVVVLEKEIDKLSNESIGETDEEIIAGMYFAKIMDGMPQGNDILDKTAIIATTWRERGQKEFHEVWKEFIRNIVNKKNELDTIKQTLAKIDIAIKSLLPKEKDVIEMFYIRRMKWEDIGRRVNYKKRYCKRIRDRAIWYMSKSIFGAGKVHIVCGKEAHE